LATNWNTQAGRALKTLAEAIERKGFILKKPILVFGSAPLQICIDPTLLSGDVDISAEGQIDEVKELVDAIGYGKGKAKFYIEVVPSYIFRAGKNWHERASTLMLHGVQFIFPDPLDILLAKLRRLDTKDLLAFRIVREKTGGPTEEQLIAELRHDYDLFYIQENGEKSVLWVNTEKLWPLLFGREINAREVIVRPVVDELSLTMEPDYLELLRARAGL
jgi:hypothetical protein